MKSLNDEIINFFHNQGCVIVSTIDRSGLVHNSCKGIVKMTRSGKIYLLDLYKARTYANLKYNPSLSITAIDEHRFMGFCLKGKVKSIPKAKLHPEIIKAWEDRITSRLTRRLLKNIRDEKGHPRHPEILLPKPQYLIIMQVQEIIDLTPQQLK